ncbi:MAG: hypothetical protein AMXMBFR56_37120 [Polyangiaceae bacterium]
MLGEQRLEVSGNPVELREAALSTLRAIGDQANHRNALRAGSKVNPVPMGCKDGAESLPDPLGPLGHLAEVVELSLLEAHEPMLSPRDSAVKASRDVS